MSLDVDVSRRFTAEGAEPFEVTASLTVGDGETLVVLGPSGSGKTLLLEAVAGFHDGAGSVTLDGRDLSGVPPERRGLGFVFQDYALFPHMTVRENVAFGARYHDDARDPDVLLADLGVADLADRTPRTLSGGEKQRVALARSLAVRPDALLLDEPLSALDVPTRGALRDDLAGILEGVTALYVTHNRTTARALADRIAVVRGGRVVQTGTPESVFERPESAFVARFTGANCLRVADLPADATHPDPGGATHLAVRPEYVALAPADAPGGPSDGGRSGSSTESAGEGEGPSTDAERRALAFEGTVDAVVREDAVHRVRVAAGETTVDAFVGDPPAVGSRVVVGVAADHLAFVDEG